MAKEINGDKKKRTIRKKGTVMDIKRRRNEMKRIKMKAERVVTEDERKGRG